MFVSAADARILDKGFYITSMGDAISMWVNHPPTHLGLARGTDPPHPPPPPSPSPKNRQNHKNPKSPKKLQNLKAIKAMRVRMVIMVLMVIKVITVGSARRALLCSYGS